MRAQPVAYDRGAAEHRNSHRHSQGIEHVFALGVVSYTRTVLLKLWILLFTGNLVSHVIILSIILSVEGKNVIRNVIKSSIAFF